MTSYTNNFPLLASVPSIVEGDAKAKLLCPTLVTPPPPEIQRHSVHFGHPPVLSPPTSVNRRRGGSAEQNHKNPKCHVGHPLHLRPHARVCVERVTRALNVMKALAGLSWGFTTETLVATYKSIVGFIMKYASPIWFTQVSSTHIDKLEVIQNKVLRIATGCYQKAAVSFLIVETGVLLLRAHLELCTTVLRKRPPTHALSRPHFTAPSNSCTQVTTPTPLLSSLVASCRWAPTP